VRGTLAELPETLDDTYERILREMPKANREHAHRLLQCLVVAVRPLTVEELAEIIAVDFSAGGGIPMLKEDLRWENQEQAVLSACSSLITVVKPTSLGSLLVHFSHFSVKEFLTSCRLAATKEDTLRYHHIRLEPAHTIMAKTCLGILLRFGLYTNITQYPLARYAADYIGDHAEFENVMSHIQDGIGYLLDTEKPHFAVWLWIRAGNHRFDYFPQQPKAVSLYYVAEFGFLRMAQYLISKRPQDMNVSSCAPGTPLYAALTKGRTEISQLLLGHYPDVDIRNSDGQSPLHLAAYNGILKIIPMLVERGADVNARDRRGQTPLHKILRGLKVHATFDMVRFLLANNADVNIQDYDHDTPLHVITSHYGSPELARLLLEHGANIHARNRKGETPLHQSCASGRLEVTRLLLKHGADPDVQDHSDFYPLFIDNPNVVRLLLEHGANLYVRDYLGTTALHLSSAQGHESRIDIVRVLLEYYTNPDVLDKRNNTPLHLASSKGNFKIVQLLFEHGANVNMQNDSKTTPLHEAATGGHLDVMRFLLDHGADVDTQTICHDTALHNAVRDGFGAAQLLLEYGANVHVRDNRGETPLHGLFTSPRPDPRFIRSFLEYGADIDIRDQKHSTLLHTMSYYGYPDGVQLLLEHGANSDAQDNKGQTPLHVSIKGLGSESYFKNKYFKVMRVLIAHGADVNAQDIDHSTPLHLVAVLGEPEPMRLLLNHGADANVRNNQGKVPSDIAADDLPLRLRRLLSERTLERETVLTA